jgi:hypothetical protein
MTEKKYIAVLRTGNSFAIGDTLEDAYFELRNLWGSDYTLDDIDLYEIGKPLSVKMCIIQIPET